MSPLWSNQSAPEDFSIEKLAKSYRAKLSEVRSETKELPVKAKFSEEKADSALSCSNELLPIEASILEIHTNHWANRDFKEYNHAA